MNLYEMRFAGEKDKHLFKNEMDLTQIAMILNSDIKFCKIGNKVIKTKEIVEVEISNMKTENKEMYDRMKLDIPIVEFPIKNIDANINNIIIREQCDIDNIAKRLSEKLKENRKLSEKNKRK